jgi:hypothetical protein
MSGFEKRYLFKTHLNALVGRYRPPFYAVFVFLIDSFLADNHALPVGGENFYKRYSRRRAC